MTRTCDQVVVIGLDCAEPSLLFERFADRLPNLTRLRDRGVWGKLRSCDPPITVPAWMSMMSSKDPGTLGYYGFRNRADRSYEKMTTATSLAVHEPLLWDFLGAAGKRVILIGVPQTYPPRPVNGLMVTDFLTPSIASNYTYPPELKDEIARLPEVHPYEFDVSDFRTPDKGKIRDCLVRMTDKRFALARHLLATKPWDFFMMVEMGTDRVHHAFWQYMDPNHHRYEPGNPFEIGHRRLLRARRSQGRRAARRAPRGRPRPRRLRPRRPVHGRRDRPQRVADPAGIPRPPRAADRPVAARSAQDRLVADDGLGLGRLLRPALPERQGTRAARPDRSRGLRGDARPPDRRARGARRPRGQADRHPGAQAREPLPDGPRGEPRPTSSSTSATCAGGRSARSGLGRSTPSRTTPAPTTPTTPRTAS